MTVPLIMAEVMSIGDFSTDALGILQSDAESESIPNLNSRRVNEVNGGTPLRVNEECIDGESVSSLDALHTFLERRNLLTNTFDGKPYDGTTIVARCSSLFNFKPKNVWRDGNIVYLEEKQSRNWHSTFGIPMQKYERLGHVTERKLTEETDDFPETFPCRPFTYRVFEKRISADCRLIVSKEVDSIYQGNTTEIKTISLASGLDNHLQKKLSFAVLTGMKQYCFATRDANDIHITRVHFVEDVTRFDTVGYTECASRFVVDLCTKLAAIAATNLKRQSRVGIFFDWTKQKVLISNRWLMMDMPSFPKIVYKQKHSFGSEDDLLHTIVYDDDRKIPQSLSISRAHVISMDTFSTSRGHGDCDDRIRFPLKKVLFLTNQETFESILHSNDNGDDVTWRFYDENESTEIPSGF